MNSIKEIVTTNRLANDQNRRKRAGLLIAFGSSLLIWTAIAAIALQIW